MFLTKIELFIPIDSFNSLPTSYQLLSPSKDYNQFNFNFGRDKNLSPLLRAFPNNQNWQQYPSSDSNLPRYRRDVLKNIAETPTLESNNSSNDSDSSRDNKKTSN